MLSTTPLHLRHSNQANALFIDGHAESLTKSEIITTADAEGNLPKSDITIATENFVQQQIR
jgi:prepilin-type processing-associated H-X9-DG protein